MTRDPADLDYANVVKRSFLVATRPENLLVLFFGGAIVVLGSLFSGFLLAGPLGVGYAHACAKMARGQRAELDDVFWRGFERLWPSVVAGFVLGLSTTALCFVLVVPGFFALLFSAVVFTSLALDKEERGGLETIQRVWELVRARPAPLVIMALIASLIGTLLTFTIIGSVVMVAFFFLVALYVYLHFFGADADPGSTQVL